jgi:hypothetical protein
MARKFLPNIDWDELDELFEEAQIQNVEDGLVKADSTASDSGDDGMGDMGDDDLGSM